MLRTNFAYTYFLRDQSVIGQRNIGLIRCREIEDTSISPLQEISVEQNYEQIARKNVKHSIPCKSQVYQVIIQRKQSDNNHEKTRQMQDNIARRLKLSPQIAGENNKDIGRHNMKGFAGKPWQHGLLKPSWDHPHVPVIQTHIKTTEARIAFATLLSETTYQGPKLQERNTDMWQRSATAGCDTFQLYLQIGSVAEDNLCHKSLGGEPARVGR